MATRTDTEPASRTVDIADEAGTAALGAELALFLKPADVIALRGDLGTGKTALARSVIRALAPDAGEFEVPSPTFTLVQPYDFTRVPVTHFDLYRIEDAQEADELGFDEALAGGVILVEWPDRAPDLLPRDRLDIDIAHGADQVARRVTLTGHGTWAPRLNRMTAIARFLVEAGWGDARRTHLQGDASTRRYERLILPDGRRAVFMDMPARTDNAPFRDGKTYAQLVHLAEDIRPVVAMTQALRGIGLAAPEILECDLELGAALLEDLGDMVFGRLDPDGPEIEQAYETACDILARIAENECAERITLPDGGVHAIAHYDADMLQMEVSLVLDWFWPACRTDPVDADIRAAFENMWAHFYDAVPRAAPVWMMRDYHSPNLMWLPDRSGLERLGILDHQDTVMGHPAYDLVSLLQDARIDVPPDRENRFLEHYLAQRAKADPKFDADGFRLAYAVYGAQRCTRLFGTFVRLDRRDGKPGYLRHIPRVSDYLERNLAHPALAVLKDWYIRYLPEDLRRGTFGTER